MAKKRTHGKFIYNYPRPAVTADVLVVSRDPKPQVLLVRRKHEPFAGMWALPGGFVNIDEDLEAAARRELEEETGVQTRKLIQLHTFGTPGRDPRGRTISVVYLTEIDKAKIKPHAADDAAEVGWHSLAHPPALAFDHAKILACARRYLQRKESSC